MDLHASRKFTTLGVLNCHQQVTGQNVKKQLCQVFLCINRSLEFVSKAIESVLAGYLMRKLTKRVVLLVLKPGMYGQWHNNFTVKTSVFKLMTQHCCEVINNILCSLTKSGCLFNRNLDFNIDHSKVVLGV